MAADSQVVAPIALNRQFVSWCSSQVEQKGDRFLTNGVSDYLRHTAKLRLEFQDVVGHDDGAPSTEGSTTPGGGRSYTPLLSLMPLSNSKTVHFIRHGEGYHNVGLNNKDAHLTAKGWEQAHALGRHMQSYGATRGVQLVVVSPLMRALETAAGVFGVHSSGAPASASSAADDSVGAQGILMVGQSEEHDVRSGHAEVLARPGLPYVAHELARERLGGSPCDSRRRRSLAAAAFPAVDFSLIESEEDLLWAAGKIEPEPSVAQRGRQLLQFIMTRPEANIAVVTHSALLWFTLAGYGHECARPVRESLHRWYENCEMRSVVLSDGGRAAPDPTWFAGGHAFSEPQQGLLEQGGGGGAGGGSTRVPQFADS